MQDSRFLKTSRMSARAKAFSVDALLGRTSSKHPKNETSDNQSADAVVSFGVPVPNRDITPVLCARTFPTRFPCENNFTQLPGCGSRFEEKNLNVDLIPSENDVRVELCGRELWHQFHEIGNEMIITKAGRRMFPAMKVKISGLDPESYYILWIDVVPVDDNRYRYVYPSSQWMVAGTGDPPLHYTSYVHPDCPATGRHWLTQVVSFDRMKLTNNKQPSGKGQVSLHSMHKYNPRLHVQRTSDLQTDPELQIDPKKSLSFTFPETVFITVTAYQNQQVTKLKIARNPFAKGFREAAKQREEVDSLECVRTPPHPFKYAGMPSSYPYPLLHHSYPGSSYMPFYCVESCHVKPVIGGSSFLHHHIGLPSYQGPPINPLNHPLTTETIDATDGRTASSVSFCSLPSYNMLPSSAHSRPTVVHLRSPPQGGSGVQDEYLTAYHGRHST